MRSSPSASYNIGLAVCRYFVVSVACVSCNAYRSAALVFLFLRMTNHTSSAMSASPTTPPTTPPAIAPTGVEDEFEGGAEFDGVADAIAVDEVEEEVEVATTTISLHPLPQLSPNNHIPSPTLTVLRNSSPAANKVPGCAHPFMFWLLYPGSPCSQQK
jgi:hypothetical protein